MGTDRPNHRRRVLFKRQPGRGIDPINGRMKRTQNKEDSMTRKSRIQGAAVAFVLALGGLVFPAPAAAHCDSLDGPVVGAAREALATGDIELVLMWVRPQDEGEIRSAFQRTLKVRGQSDEARELADRWFFETLVRVHRAGEGAPYTGLKPAGYEPPAGIAAADRAMETGSVSELSAELGDHVVTALQERYQRVMELRTHANESVEAGRHYVHAYVEYIHFVEKLHGVIHGSGDEHGASTTESH